tara:strand:- start:245 stop:466 length:222 start_codon:yes stop_codon:yes gene_type:complete
MFEYEELVGMYDEICELLKDRADLLKVFTDLIKNGDPNYETESTASSEEYSDSEVVCEKIQVKKDEKGFLSID